QAAIPQSVVVLTRAPGQRFQGCTQSCAADLVEDAVDEDDTFVGVGQGQAPCLHALLLFIDKPFGVGLVAGVQALGAEFLNAEVGRLSKQLALVEALANRGRGVGDQVQVGEADLACGQGYTTPAPP